MLRVTLLLSRLLFQQMIALPIGLVAAEVARFHGPQPDPFVEYDGTTRP